MMEFDLHGTIGAVSIRRVMASEFVPALMLATAVGFIAAVTPVDLIERLVVRSGLPSLMSATTPPLGFTARAIMVAGSFVATLAAVWLLLRLAGKRPPIAGARRSRDEPRLRAADRHPDAPARRPFFADETLSLAVSDVPAPMIARTPQPPEPRSISELLATLESRLCNVGAHDGADQSALGRGHG